MTSARDELALPTDAWHADPDLIANAKRSNALSAGLPPSLDEKSTRAAHDAGVNEDGEDGVR